MKDRLHWRLPLLIALIILLATGVAALSMRDARYFVAVSAFVTVVGLAVAVAQLLSVFHRRD